MKLHTLELENFMSIGAAVIPLADQGLVLIEGENEDDPTVDSNGAGKSTIFEALFWCLYGRTLRGYEGDEVIKRGEKSCVVCVTFIDDGARTWEVSRKRGPARLTVLVDGKDVTSGGRMSEAQKLVDDALGMTATTFLATVMFDGDVIPFSMLADKEQKAVLERLVGIEDITEAHKRASAKLSEIRLERAAAEAAVVAQEKAVEAADRHSRDLETAFENWETAHQGRLEAVKRAETALPASRMAKAKAAAKAAADALDKAREALEAADGAVAGAAAELANGRAILSAKALTSEKARTAHVKAEKLGTADCPTCGQYVTATHKSRRVADLLMEKTEAERVESQWVREVREREKAVAEKEATRKAAKIAARDCEQTANRRRDELRLAEQLDKDRARLLAERTQIEAEVNTLEPAATAATKAFRAAGADLINKKKAAAKLVTLEAHLTFLVEAFSNKGLKSFVLDTITPYLNERATEYATKLSGGAFEVEFQTQSTLKDGSKREKFAVLARNAHGAEVLTGNSRGEKRKINVAIALALQALAAGRSKSQLNLAFYDEPFDALDSTAGEYAMDLLNEEAKKKDTVLVISHRPEFKSLFPRVWTVRKSNGTSTVET